MDYHVLVHTGLYQWTVCNYQGWQGINIQSTPMDHMSECQATATQILDWLVDGEAVTEKEKRAIAQAWGIATEYYEEILKLEQKGKVTHEEAEFQIRKFAYILSMVTQHRAAITTPEILKAAPEQLSEWADYYDEQVRHHHEKMKDQEERRGQLDMTENPVWNYHRSKIELEAWKWWQCQRRLGEL